MTNIQIERLKNLPQRPKDTWQGGLVRTPAWITEERPKPYRPWIALWVSIQDGFIHGSAPVAPEEKNLAMAVDTLVDLACNEELAGYRPGHLQVNDSALAEHLEGLLAEAGISVEYRPKLLALDHVMEDMTTRLTGGEPRPSAMNVPGMTVERMRAFAEAARDFYLAAPWEYLTDEDLLRIETPATAPGLGWVTVLGAGGHVYGLGFFESARDWEVMRDLNDPEQYFSSRSAWSVDLGSITELAFGDADVWEDHDLPVAGERGYPFARCFGPGKRLRRASPRVLAFLEGLMRALAQTSEDEIDCGRWSKTVATHDGPVEFTLALPGLLDEQPVSPSTRRMPDPRVMEKATSEMQRFLDEHEFSSVEEANNLLLERFGGGNLDDLPSTASTPLEKAQDLIYEAIESGGRKAVQLARQALEICPDCADAYVLMAEHTSDVQKAHDLYAQGVAAGERALGPDCFEENAGHFWGLQSTRPYMRARLGLAMCLEDMGEWEEAVEHYQAMLRLNPNDNQGIRDLLMPCLLELERDADAAALWKQYEEEGSALWRYARALITFRQEGDTAKAGEHLKTALKTNRYVPKYLLDEEALPEALPGSYSIGDRDEAIFCSLALLDAWDTTPGAEEWLASHTKSH